MKENAENLVYLSAKTYISLKQLKDLALCLVATTIFAIIYSSATSNWLWAITLSCLTLVYILFILIVQSNYVLKTFQLRFLVNGISAIFLSLLFSIIFFPIPLILNPKLSELLLPFIVTYLLFVVIYLGLIGFGVKRNVFKKIRKFNKRPTILGLSALFSGVLPFLVLLGRLRAKYILEEFTNESQTYEIFICGWILLFIVSLGFINFIQYYYCLKYSIDCDEEGNVISEKLLPHKWCTRKTTPYSSKKNKGLLALPSKKALSKIILVILAIPLAFFLLLLIIGFILNL